MEQDPLSTMPPWRTKAEPTTPVDGIRPDTHVHLGEAEEASDPPPSDWDALGKTRVLLPGEDAKSATPVQIDIAETFSEIGAPGSQLGDFKIIRKLGQGAMATVYKAWQISFGRKVALKILHKHIADNPKLLERFYREARVMFDLDHPNIVQGYVVDEINGVHFCAMEYISGQSLQKVLNKVGRLSVPDALFITLACARALEYAHNQDIIHRDIKPDNVLITKQGQVKVADLGMVKMMDEDIALTQTGHAVGTPWYMPLEQARNSKDVDCRCDIYALGCMLYCMLTGKPPFTGPTLVEVIQAKEQGTFPPARQFNIEVPEKLDLIICKMTHKQPKHRYQSCSEVVHDLESLELAGTQLSWMSRAEPIVTPTSTTIGEASLTVAPREPRTPLPAHIPATEDDVWYLKQKGGDGQVMMRKYSTAQILRLLETEQISPRAKISRDEFTGFRAVATYKEFEQTALGLATKRGVDKATSRYRQLYKKIEQEEQERAGEAEDSCPRIAFLDMLCSIWPYAAAVVAGTVVLWLAASFARFFTR